MKLLLLGSSGLLGQAIAREARRRGLELREAARRGAPILLDIADENALRAVLEPDSPDLQINCAALVNISLCERDSSATRRLNARPLGFLSHWSRETGGKLLHVSTDHYFPGRDATPH